MVDSEPAPSPEPEAPTLRLTRGLLASSALLFLLPAALALAGGELAIGAGALALGLAYGGLFVAAGRPSTQASAVSAARWVAGLLLFFSFVAVLIPSLL